MGLFRRRQTLEERGFFKGYTDWHCHLLPGVDDGVRTLKESLQILAEYERLGITTVWLTPHIMEDIPNTTMHLRERHDLLRTAYAGSIDLHLAAENMLDTLFEERLEAGDLLPIGPDGNHLLVETSYVRPPMDLKGVLQRIMSAGYFPILAHPERYVYMEMKDYKELKEMGVKLQRNLFSEFGIYGSTAKKKSRRIAKANLYDLTGTDLHNYRTLEYILDKRI